MVPQNTLKYIYKCKKIPLLSNSKIFYFLAHFNCIYLRKNLQSRKAHFLFYYSALWRKNSVYWFHSCIVFTVYDYNACMWYSHARDQRNKNACMQQPRDIGIWKQFNNAVINIPQSCGIRAQENKTSEKNRWIQQPGCIRISKLHEMQ